MDIHERLRQMIGNTHAPERDAPQERLPAPHRAIEELVPGRWLERSGARVYLSENRFPLVHRHGDVALGELVDVAQVSWPTVLFQDHAPFDLSRAVFIDTETTGLGRGSGTVCFMVGVGHLEEEQLLVRQYFMPDYPDEPYLLELVEEEAHEGQGFISFNGRSFDLPLLETRYVLNGHSASPLSDYPHLDLLSLARRLWGRILPSCALASLETHLLSVIREQADVPGYLIPQIYYDYLATGATQEIAGVFYHNVMDILSMVTLTVRAASVMDHPENEATTSIVNSVALGRLREADDAPDEALAAYRRGTVCHEHSTRQEARRRLSFLLKRMDRVDEAAEVWTEALADGQLYPYVELAKYYEHRVGEFAEAIILVREAISGIHSGRIECTMQKPTLAELRHRLDRLERRLDRQEIENNGDGAQSESV